MGYSPPHACSVLLSRKLLKCKMDQIIIRYATSLLIDVLSWNRITIGVEHMFW